MVERRLLLVGICIALAAMTLLPLRYQRYQIATGSMAPTLLGEHRRCACSRCGSPVVVGSAAPDCFKAHCPNCGHSDLPLAQAPDQPGDVVSVDRWAYSLASPKRWDVVLFQRGEESWVKRIAGLPGETVEIRDGDVWIDGVRSRKSFGELPSMQQELFDDAYSPHGIDASRRWERDPRGELVGGRPMLDGRDGSQTWIYARFLFDERQYRPFVDEYAYEGSSRADAEPVHDFIADLDLTVLHADGNLRVALTDGSDVIEASISLTNAGSLKVRTRPDSFEGKEAPALKLSTVRMTPWRGGETRRVTVAFVDRRFHIACDGKPIGDAIDLPDAASREPVVRPLRLTIERGCVRVDRFRLSRDVHYRPQGMAGQAVRLGSGEYFVLGDHSPVAEDSRTWLDPAIRRRDLLGRVLDLKRPRSFGAPN